MRDRYFSSRVRRLFREKGWSMAEFSRRSNLGRARLKRIMETRGYCYSVTSGMVAQLAVAFNVTQDYLERGVGAVATPPSATATQFEISRLRAENDRLRRTRRTGEPMLETINRAEITTLLTRASDAKLEFFYRDGKYVVVREHEYEIAEAPTMKAAMEIALNDSDND